MSTNVVRAPQTTEIGARLRISVAIGLVALAFVAAVLVFSSNDSPTVSGAAVRTGGGPDEAAVAKGVASGRTFVPAHPDESATSAAVSRGSGETDEAVPEPNLLPK